MTRSLLIILAFSLLGGVAQAQLPSPAAPGAPKLEAPASTGTTNDIDRQVQEAVQREVAKVKEQLREEVRAEIQGAQSAAEFLGAQEQKQKLQLLELNGYFRFRWDLFNNLNGGLPADPMGWYAWNGNVVVNPSQPAGTQTTGNMRLRIDPTFNVSEQVRIRATIDFLDNVVMGSTPWGRDYAQFAFQSDGQLSPVYGGNWFWNAVSVKRAWGEVQTPVGMLSFGRMPGQWGMGLYWNPANGIDDDYGTSVDRIQFAIPLGQLLGGLAVIPYYDWMSAGVTYLGAFNTPGIGEPIDYLQDDNAGAIGIRIVREDTPDQVRRKLDKGQSSVNYGLLFNYASQRFGLPMLAMNNTANTTAAGVTTSPALVPGVTLPVTLIRRDFSAGTFDLFFRWMSKKFEVEAEAVGIWGSLGNASFDPTVASASVAIRQAGGAVRGKAKLGEAGRIQVGGEFGIASGDTAPGMGVFPGRCDLVSLVCNERAAAGAIDGQQFSTNAALDPSPDINNFRFNPAYRVDLILWRRILGTVTDAWYLKPTFRWEVLDGLNVSAQVVYSQALFAESTPSQVNRPLGIEMDLGVKYQSDDGFLFFIDYGLLGMLSGFKITTGTGNSASVASPSGVAQDIHLGLGIVF